MITLQSYLQGQWQSGEGEGAPLHDPTRGEVIARASTAGLDLLGALDWAREKGGPALRAMSFAERGAALKAMSKALHDAREALIEISIRSAGTPRSDAKFDIDGAIGTLAYYASLGRGLGDRCDLVEGEGEALTRSSRFWGHHVKVPIRGVAVHVNAFNFPAWGFAEKAAVALLAGVPVITKPATATAWLTVECVRAIVEAGALPEGALQLVSGSTGPMLEHLGEQDALAFTGSASTGTMLRGLPNMLSRSVRVNVEADSLNAALLAPGVEPGSPTWEMFIRDVGREISQKTGQKCTAVRRILVPEALVEPVREALAEELGRVRIGDPADPSCRMGPISTAAQRDDVLAGIDALVSAGAEIVYQAERPELAGFFVAPTLLLARAPEQASAVHEREVFGPVATILPYADMDQAARLVALGLGSLVTSVYGDDPSLLGPLLREIAPHTGRILLGSKKIADQAIAPGMVLPSCVHGGPGRAGGGEELGGLRGLDFYMQRTAVQGDRALLDRLFGVSRAKD